MHRRVVIIGGVAGGATAAARLKRLSKAVDVTLVERGPDVSFANCGLPYYIGREIQDRSRLLLQTPEGLSTALGVEVLTKTTATTVDTKKKIVTTIDATSGAASRTLEYDTLILSPGASPLRPAAIPGIGDARIATLRNMQDMDKIDAAVRQPNVKKITVIGAGFIGLEVVEQLHRIGGKEVTLVEKFPAVLPQVDTEIAEFLHGPMAEAGVRLMLDHQVMSFAPNSRGALDVRVASKCGTETALDSDYVVLAIGVRPDSSLAKDAGIKCAGTGHIVVDEFMRTSASDVYAVGDAVETQDLVFPEKRAAVALGNIANMQARIAADHICLSGSPQSKAAIPYRGSLGTSIVRVFDHVVAVTGWNAKRLEAAGIPFQTATVTADNHAGYYPGALPITLKVFFDPNTGRIFGGQGYGIDGVDKRVDVIATAITGGLTVDDLSLTQLCYSPPFGSARDVANLAGLAARNIRSGFVKTLNGGMTPANTQGKTVVDVRPAEAAALHPIPGAVNIPSAELPSKFPTMDKSKSYVTVCALGKTSYFAARKFALAGFSNTESLSGGLRVWDKPKPGPAIPQAAATASCTVTCAAPKAVVNLDCTGLSCPGPLLKLKQEIDKLGKDCQLCVTATDPGFAADVKAFASSRGITCDSVTLNKGIITAKLTNTAVCGAATGPSSATGARKGATIVVFSQDMDKVLASFVIANGAAAMGGEVTMFFTFWGLNALRNPRKSGSGKSLVEFAFGKMMPKGMGKLQLSNYNMGGMGAILMKREMRVKKLPNLPLLLQQAKEQKIRLVACTMSMDAMGIKAEELIDGVEYGGVAEYLAAAEKTGTNLFI